jgi:hypothetical protein
MKKLTLGLSSCQQLIPCRPAQERSHLPSIDYAASKASIKSKLCLVVFLHVIIVALDWSARSGKRAQWPSLPGRSRHSSRSHREHHKIQSCVLRYYDFVSRYSYLPLWIDSRISISDHVRNLLELLWCRGTIVSPAGNLWRSLVWHDGRSHLRDRP